MASYMQRGNYANRKAIMSGNYRSGYMARAKSNLQVDAEDKRLHADKDRCHKEIAILITRALSSAFKIS